ncbi:hypothetical protein LZL87_003112 [Fusarium oxysporum]|nr:hypothetical protein LZL87_003112 [Fusarium oxysporum]
MKSADRWALQYAQGMADWSFGHACYHRTSSKDVKPGSVGYFDRNGNWKKILSLHDVQKTGEPVVQGISKKFTRLAEPITMHDDVEMEIGTLTSSQTVSTDAGFKIELQVDIATPINVGTDNAYRNSNTLGAVLVMKNPVVRSSIEDGAFLDRWFKENQRLFPEIRSAVREHGVWLVTTTYTTEEIALNVWQDKDKVVKLGFSVGIDGIVNLEPSIERGEKKHADGSLIYRAKSDEKLVSFVGGIRFHYRSHVWTTGKLKPGVAYLQDPRTYHFQEWTEAERVGTEARQNPPLGQRSIAYAVQKREAEIVDMLLAAGASPDGDPEDTMDFHSMKSPLIIAVQAGNEDLVARLIKAGANVDQYFSQYGRSLTPLYAASMKGHLAIMRQLLDAGATIDGKAGYLGTPLLAAVSEGHVEVMTLLLDAGADLQARSAVNKYPALVVALDKGHPEVVENLINAGANVNDSAEYYGSALQAAAFKGYRDVAEKLLDVGADPAMEGGRYGLAIFAAAAKQRVDVVKMFIDRRVVTKEQAKKAKDRVEEMIESGDDRSTEFHEILEILSSVVE